MTKLQNTPNIDFDGSTLNIYPDISKETLDCRRALKPLLEQLRGDGITYRWGFPACLIATKNGGSFTLRFPEEHCAFLQDLNLPHMELPVWQNPIPTFSVPGPPNGAKPQPSKNVFLPQAHLRKTGEMSPCTQQSPLPPIRFQVYLSRTGIMSILGLFIIVPL